MKSHNFRKDRSMEGSIFRLKRAVSFSSQGRFDKAEKIFKKLRKEFPNWLDPYKFSGLNAIYDEKYQMALNFFQKAAWLSPESPEIYDLLGTAQVKCQKPQEAKASYEKALEINPNNSGVQTNLGNVLRELGDLEGAQNAYEMSLKIDPDYRQARVSLATVFHELGQYSKAEEIYKLLVVQKSCDVGLYINYSSTLLFQKKVNLAIEVCDEGLQRFGESPELLFSKGHLLGLKGELSQSARVLERLLLISPGHAQGSLALSIHYFLDEKWSEAWQAYEARFHTGNVSLRPFSHKFWQGEDLSGKTILIWGEQGVGDEVMFISMLPDIINAGADIIFETDERLLPIFQRSFPSVKFWARESSPAKELNSPLIDFQCPSGNLGRWLRRGESDFPKCHSFLVTQKSTVEKLRGRYKKARSILVGLAWQSKNPEIGEAKSVTLKSLQPFFEVSGVRFIDLQYGDTSQERESFYATSGYELFHDDSIDQMKSLDSFACQVGAMDLIISISNTTVHMAGALGVPVWVMLQNIPDRRWLMDRRDSPWYSGVRLYRQKAADEWGPVINDIKSDLEEYVKII